MIINLIYDMWANETTSATSERHWIAISAKLVDCFTQYISLLYDIQ